MITLPEPALAGVRFEGGAIAVMRDGVRLVADIYRPVPTSASPGPWPVLLMRQPYGRDIASTVVYAHPSWYARQGFLVVVQDVRGRGDSEGNFYPFRNEIEDGYDTVLWAAALPEANGRVGMYGFSYQGSTQLLAALSNPLPLKALAPHMTAFDLHSGWFYRGGLLQLSTTLGWAGQMLREDSRRRGDREAEAALDENWPQSGRLSSHFPVRAAPPLTHLALPTYAKDWLEHPEADDYWAEFNLLDRVAELGLPMFHLSGWYDFYLRGSIDGYRAIAARHAGQFLLAAPWTHLPWGPQTAVGFLGSAAAAETDAQLAAWFHHWLDHETPPTALPASLNGCRYFVLGANTWHQTEVWPPKDTTWQTWFLDGGGRANSRFGDGRLSLEPPGVDSPDDLFNYDPEVPVLAPGGNQGGHATFGPHELSAQQQGNNLLVYTSPPFAAALTVAGHPACVIQVQSSAEETAFVVRLSRVTPDTRATFLCLGAVKVAAVDGAEIRVALDPVAARFEAGDCLRIDVASSAFPLLIRHPNTRTDPASVERPGDFLRALQIVRHNATFPSRLELPVLNP